MNAYSSFGTQCSYNILINSLTVLYPQHHQIPFQKKSRLKFCIINEKQSVINEVLKVPFSFSLL